MCKILFAIATYLRKIIMTLDTINTKLDSLQSALAAESAKVDQLIALLQSVAAGETALDAIEAKIDGITSTVAAESAKEDAAIAANTPAPAPAPAPVDSPAPAPADGGSTDSGTDGSTSTDPATPAS